MVYTEIKERNNRKYYYRVKSIRKGKKVQKERKHIEVNLSKNDLNRRENKADNYLNRNKKNKELEKIKQKIKEVLKKNNIKRAGMFGSYARGDQKKNSDIDILIEPTKDMSLLDISGLKINLEENLNNKVDIISYKYIHPYLKKKILQEQVRII